MENNEDYSFDDDIHEKIDKKISRKIDVDSVEERVERIEQIKGNPPKKDFMKTSLYESKIKTDEGDSEKSFIVAKDEKGELWKDQDGNVLVYDPIFEIDLKTLSDAQFADCASNVIPMLIDQAVNVAVTLKKDFKPEKRKEMFNYWWIVMALLMIPGIILIILLFMSGG